MSTSVGRVLYRITNLTRHSRRIIFRVLPTINVMSRVRNSTTRQVRIIKRSINLQSTSIPRMITITNHHTRTPHLTRRHHIPTISRPTTFRLIRHHRYQVRPRQNIITNVLRLRRLRNPFSIQRTTLTRFRVPITPRTTQRTFNFRTHLRLTSLTRLYVNRQTCQMSRQIHSIIRRVLTRHPIPNSRPNTRRHLVFPHIHP